jgi:hypothetical protein
MDCTTGQSRFDPRQRQEDFYLTSVPRTALGPTQPPLQCVPRVVSQGIKRSRGVTLTTPSSAEVKDEQELYLLSAPTPPLVCCETALPPISVGRGFTLLCPKATSPIFEFTLFKRTRAGLQNNCSVRPVSYPTLHVDKE